MPIPRLAHGSSLTIDIDVSEILRTPFLTGIQRVVRELTTGLLATPGLRIRLLSWDDDERAFGVVAPEQLLARFADPEAPVGPTGVVRIEELGSDDVLLELDAVWNSPLSRDELYAALDEQGATIIVLVFDLIPVKFPELCPVPRWAEYLDAVVAHADLALTISRSTEADLHDHLRAAGVERHLPTTVLTLGSELPAVRELTAEELRFVSKVAGTPFLLFVGTLEPRKHQLDALLAFDQLAEEFPGLQLVIAGRMGWDSVETARAILRHPTFGRRVYWLRGASDRLVDHLYSTAFATVYLTSYEGWGLPVAESLGLGTITVTSLTSSLPEVGGTAADYVHHRSPSALAAVLRGYLSDPELAATRRVEIASGYSRPRWVETVDRLARVVAQLPVSLGALAAPSGRHPRVDAASTTPGFDDLLDDLTERHDLGAEVARYELADGRRLYLSVPRVELSTPDDQRPVLIGWRLAGPEAAGSAIDLELRGGSSASSSAASLSASSGTVSLALPTQASGVEAFEPVVRVNGAEVTPDAVAPLVRIVASDIATARELFGTTQLATRARPVARRVRDEPDPLRPVRRALKPIVARTWPRAHDRVVAWRTRRLEERERRWFASHGL